MYILGKFRQLVTMDHLPASGAIDDDCLEILPDAGILIDADKIIEIADFDVLTKKHPHVDVVSTAKNLVAFPGLIDAHTHICWAGSRSNDYAMRLKGKTYLEIAATGGGIWDTVNKTRNATEHELLESLLYRANLLLKQGITTIEVKSGYGLSVDEELRILRVINRAHVLSNADLIPTCLAAHVLPKDIEISETAYLNLLVSDLLPQIKSEQLANRIDIFVEQGAFSMEGARNYLLQAQSMGFDTLMHGDQFSIGAAQLAVDLNVLSIDHLEAATESEIAILSQSNVSALVLPGASMGLGEPFAPARKMLDAGLPVVIASDWNPGSAPMGNLMLQAAVLGACQKLTMAETWASITYRAANALKIKNKGVLKAGFIADIVGYDVLDYREILYRQGQLLPEMIWKNGVEITK